MRFKFGALFDPLFQQFFLGGRESEIGVGRRHELILRLAVQAFDKFAFSGISRHNTEVAAEIGVGVFGGIEAKLGVLVLGVGAVALEAVVRDEWLDLTVERNFGLQRSHPGDHSGGDEDAKK